MNIPDHVISDAVQAIITSRDFCGDERAAAMDIAHAHGFIGAEAEKIRRIANFRANSHWNAWKKAAGVNPKYTW